MAEAVRVPRAAAVPRLWRAADVAHFYGVDESTIHRWERTGRIRASRRDPGGTKYWVDHEVIDEALAEPVARARAELVPGVEELVTATRRPRSRR